VLPGAASPARDFITGATMQIGSPFNHIKSFRASSHRIGSWNTEASAPAPSSVTSGCWVMPARTPLLLVAGKLGKGLGVSDRQVRDYVKELERAGLIAVEQRGLRKTNIYLFLWTAELEALCNSVPDSLDDPEEGPDGPGDPPLASKPSSGLDRKSCSGLERNYLSGPIGINSEGISSLESSSSSEALGSPPEAARKRTIPVVGTISSRRIGASVRNGKPHGRHDR